MSTQNEQDDDNGACQYYCGSATTSLCTQPGTAPPGAALTTTDGSQTGDLLRFCWLKDKATSKAAPSRMGPWI